MLQTQERHSTWETKKKAEVLHEMIEEMKNTMKFEEVQEGLKEVYLNTDITTEAFKSQIKELCHIL